MNTPPGDALPMDPRILQDSVARLRSGAARFRHRPAGAGEQSR